MMLTIENIRDSGHLSLDKQSSCYEVSLSGGPECSQ